jgi:hypothetical protein
MQVVYDHEWGDTWVPGARVTIFKSSDEYDIIWRIDGVTSPTLLPTGTIVRSATYDLTNTMAHVEPIEWITMTKEKLECINRVSGKEGYMLTAKIYHYTITKPPNNPSPEDLFKYSYLF